MEYDATERTIYKFSNTANIEAVELEKTLEEKEVEEEEVKEAAVRR